MPPRIGPRPWLRALFASLLAVAPVARAAEFHEDFGLGMPSPHWAIIRSQDVPQYIVDGAPGEGRFAKRVDPTHDGRQSIRFELLYPLLGDFSAEVQFHGAYLARLHPAAETGLTPGNSVRLTAVFPGLAVSAVRSEEQNAIPSGLHAWVEPPGFAYGRLAGFSPSGSLRIQRTGFIYSVFGDGQLLTSGFMVPDTVRSIALELVNDGTIDSTSVRFDDFVVIADDILFGSPTLGTNPAPVRDHSLHVLPNPSTGRVTLALELSEAADVRLEVFDAQGRRVALVHDARLSPGRHDLVWNDAGAADRAPGLYFAVARVGAAVLTRRLVVTR